MPPLAAIRHHAEDTALQDILALIRAAFAGMEGRIDPPSSVHRLTLEALRRHCGSGEVWSLGPPPAACMLLTVRPDCLYLGKMATAHSHRRQGLARRLAALAEDRARALGLAWLELQTRVELVENHAAFARMGFAVAGMTAHPGFERATSITMRRRVG